MYAWKCWRESRLVVSIVVAFEIFFFLIACFAKAPGFPTHLPVQVWQAWAAWTWMHNERVLFFVLPFFTAGIPLSSFSLTRPITRQRMIWTAFGISLAEMAVVFAIAGLSASIYVALVPLSINASVPLSFSLGTTISLLVIAHTVSAALVRGLLVLMFLLLPKRKKFFWVAPAIMLFFACLVLATMQPRLAGLWSQWLPAVLPEVMVQHGTEMQLQPHLWLELAARAGLTLLLVFASQKLLEAREL